MAERSAKPVRLKGDQSLPVSLADAWHALNDTELLKSAIPGCESITLVEAGDDAFEGRSYDLRMTVTAGPVDAIIRGTLSLRDLRPPRAYTLQFRGDAGGAGFGDATAAVDLVVIDDASTRLVYDAEVTVGGPVAKVGSLILGIAARRVARRFFEGFSDLLRDRKRSA